MVPARSRLFHHDSSSGGGGNSSSCTPQYCIATQFDAAAPPRRRHHLHQQPAAARYQLAMAPEDDAAAGTSSRGGGAEDDDDDDKDWLQLGLAAAAPTSSSGATAPAAAAAAAPSSSTPTAPELDVFAAKQYNGRLPLFPLPILRSYHHHHHQQYGHGGGRCPPPSFFPFARPLRSSGDLPGVMRVISPPRRAAAADAAGLWLTLQASPDQFREPILPQIPKSYLRIKDSNMKVEVVMKYLAGKLGLTQSHLQVELTCRGQLLPPFLLVKNVRDSIWCSSLRSSCREDEDDDGDGDGDGEDDPVELHRRSPAAAATTDHVMALVYSTSSSCH
uniref:Uncharacterized protein n=1 Tax=Oryza meridionalis TaxID=40149 RepID=A0A0E0CCI0_9ORYZ